MSGKDIMATSITNIQRAKRNTVQKKTEKKLQVVKHPL